MTAPGRLLERVQGRRGRLIIAGVRQEPLERAARAASGAGLEDPVVVGPGGMAPERHARHRDVAILLRTNAPDRVRDAIHALDLASDPLLFGAGLLALGEGVALVAPGCSLLSELADVARWALGAGASGRVHPPTAAACLLAEDGHLTLAADCGLPGSREPAALARIGQTLVGLRARLAEDSSVVAFLEGPEPCPPPPPEATTSARSARAAFSGIAPTVPLTPEDPPGGRSDGRFRPRANVLIFPDSTAGYLTVRALRGYGRVALIGPLIVGAERPVLATPADASDGELAGAAAVAVLLADSPGH